MLESKNLKSYVDSFWSPFPSSPTLTNQFSHLKFSSSRRKGSEDLDVEVFAATLSSPAEAVTRRCFALGQLSYEITAQTE